MSREAPCPACNGHDSVIDVDSEFHGSWCSMSSEELLSFALGDRTRFAVRAQKADSTLLEVRATPFGPNAFTHKRTVAQNETQRDGEETDARLAQGC